jgi:hypothetical protein
MQRKRSLTDVDTPVTPASASALTSSRGRIVKPKLWGDGTEAPLALGTGAKAERAPAAAASEATPRVPTPPPKEDADSDQPSSTSDRPSR